LEKRKIPLEATPEEIKKSRSSPRLVRSLRKKLGISQKELAILAGVTVGAARLWEKGKFKPKDEKKAVMVTLRRQSLIGVLMGVVIILIVSSCATVPIKPLAPGELRLLSMATPQKLEIKVNVPFEVNINFEADGEPEIRNACFYWAGDGPHCYKVTDVNYGSPGTIKVKLAVTRPGSCTLDSYVVYTREGKGRPTNVVSFNIHILQ
jgi:DNA-binding transcriptional regulator YiaG